MSHGRLALGFVAIPVAWVSFFFAGCSTFDATAFDTFRPDPRSVPILPPPGKPATQPAKPGTLKISVSQAILMAMANNQQLIVDEYKPLITKTAEDVAKAAFDPLVTGEYSNSHYRSKSMSANGPVNSGPHEGNDILLGLQQTLPTGTEYALSLENSMADTDYGSGDFFHTRLGIEVTQPLLRGFGIDVNLTTLRQARIDTLSSRYELRGFAEDLVRQTEQAYWDYALSQRQIDIFNQSLQIAQQQLDETRERIRIGKLAEMELAAAEAEVALRHEDLIDGKSALDKARLTLLRLLGPPGGYSLDRDVVLTDQPVVSHAELGPVEGYIKVALNLRSDLNQARLQVQRGDLQIVFTKNGLLPQLNLFVNFGKSAYSDSFLPSADFSTNPYDVQAGVTGNWSPINRQANAQYRQAILSRDQSAAAVSNLAQLVEVDVRDAYIEVNRLREQVAATAATRKLEEEKLRAETEKFRVGKSTTLLVGQAQRDYQNSQLAEVQAVANYLKALVALYRAEGSLLDRNGISAVGGETLPNGTR